MDLVVGDTLGPFRILRLLGRGGMGAVYEAEHRELGTRHAVKVFTRSHDEALLRRFLAEGRLLARLEHPRLVRVSDLGFDEAHGCAWFAMELVLDAEGSPCTLEDARRSGKVDEVRAAAWFGELREALAYVHERGIAHRDVKLENILVDAEGHAVLSDFGVSRILDPGLRSAAGLTTTATFADATAASRPVLGTLGYLAPEVRAGGEATASADLYALGVSMFRLLTGIWYEPGTDVLALLEPFEYNWDEVLPPLLALNPTDRRFAPMAPGPVGTSAKTQLGRRLGWILGAAVLLVLAGTAFGWSRWNRSRSENAFETLFAAPEDFEDDEAEGDDR